MNKSGTVNSYQKVDDWVAAHPLKPSDDLMKRANAAIDRVSGENSELRESWNDSEKKAQWLASVEDLRQRLRR